MEYNSGTMGWGPKKEEEENGLLNGIFNGLSLWGGTDANGIKTNSGMELGLGAAQGLFNGWLGMKKLGIAKDQLKENKRQFNMNWGAQRKTVNNQLANAQRVRASANPNAQPVSEYMNKWGIE